MEKVSVDEKGMGIHLQWVQWLIVDINNQRDAPLCFFSIPDINFATGVNFKSLTRQK